jgi:transcriptional regulator GlxA family with amidase domain
MIERSLDDGIDLARIAAGVALSRRQLERDFQRWIGEAPRRYVRRLRLIRAVAALGGGAPIAQVALDHGFADQAHFTRTARLLAGQTPGALRRRIRADPLATDRCH